MSLVIDGERDRIEVAKRLCDEARFEEARATLELALRDAADPLARVAVQLALVTVANEEDWVRGRRNHEAKYELLREIDAAVDGSPSLRAHALFQRGMAMHLDFVMADGDLERQLEYFTEAATLFESEGDLDAAAHATAFIGISHHVGRLDRDTAEPILRRAYEMAPASGGSEARFEAARHLGQICQERGDMEEALVLLEESLRACAEGLRPRSLPAALHAVGFARLEAGDDLGAADALERARYYSERYGDVVFAPMIARAQAELEFQSLSGEVMRGRTHP